MAKLIIVTEYGCGIRYISTLYALTANQLLVRDVPIRDSDIQYVISSQ